MTTPLLSDLGAIACPVLSPLPGGNQVRASTSPARLGTALCVFASLREPMAFKAKNHSPPSTGDASPPSPSLCASASLREASLQGLARRPVFPAGDTSDSGFTRRVKGANLSGGADLLGKPL